MDPFSDNPPDTLGAIGELGLLRHIRLWLGPTCPPPPHGMGDDCAVLPPAAAAANLLTTDSLVYQRHFTAALAPEEAGAKLLKRSLSDIAAMGGIPLQAVLAGCFPRRTALAWLERFVRGLAVCAEAHGVAMVGGDLSETATDLVTNLTLLGRADRPLLRTGGGAGDRVCVTGRLGGSLVNQRHARFTPRLAEGRALAADPAIRVCIDLTDGLRKDLAALLSPGVAARLDLTALPLHADAGGDPARALDDGEDYELLFLLPRDIDPAAWLADWAARGLTPATCIGELVEHPRAILLDARTGQPLPPGHGYEHFN